MSCRGRVSEQPHINSTLLRESCYTHIRAALAYNILQRCPVNSLPTMSASASQPPAHQAAGCCLFRSVLGIINHPGSMAEFISLPASNLHLVPEQLTDAHVAFCEPLAAACRILEQGLLHQQQGSKQNVVVMGEPRQLAGSCTWINALVDNLYNSQVH